MQLISLFTRQRMVFWLFMLAYLLLSLQVLAVFFHGSEFATNYMRHDQRPVMLRALIPLVSDTLNGLIPDSIRPALAAPLLSLIEWQPIVKLIRAAPQRFAWVLEPNEIVATGVRMAVVYLSLVAFLAMFYRLASSLLPGSRAYALFAPMLALLIMPVCYQSFGYTYDFADLFFSCALLYLLHKQRFTQYLAVLALATFNKETSLFTIFFFAIYFIDYLPRRNYLLLLGAQLATYAAIKGGLEWHYAAYPFLPWPPENGQVLRLNDNISYVLNYLFFYSVLGLVAVFLLLTYRWEEKPVFLRRAIPMFGLNVLVCFFMNSPGEFRNWLWGMPPLVLLATHSLLSANGMDRWPVFAAKK